MADEWRYSLHQRLAAHVGERGDALYSLGAGALAITVSSFAAFSSGQPNRRRVIHGVLITFDPNPHAIPCNTGQARESITLYLCEICKLVQRSATTDRTLVMSRGKRFESA